MTKNKLLELYAYLKKEKLNVYALKELSSYTDEEIDSILKNDEADCMLNNQKIATILVTSQNETFKLLSLKQRKQIIFSICRSKTKDIAFYIHNIATSENIVLSGKAVDLAKILSESVGDDQAYIALNAIKNLNILLNSKCINLVRVISQAKSTMIAEMTYIVAKNKNILSNEMGIELTKLVSMCNEQYKADYASGIASALVSVDHNLAIECINKILQAKDESEAIKIRNMSMDILLENTKKKNNVELFWNIFSNNADNAISLLESSESITDNKEITPNTRIRKKQ